MLEDINVKDFKFIKGERYKCLDGNVRYYIKR